MRRILPFFLSLLAACDPAVFRPQILVVDEQGAPVAGAVLHTRDGEITTDQKGMARLRLDRPELILVSADSFLTEPLPIGRDLAEEMITLRLLAAQGRTVLHSTGDVMLGRRYVSPDEGEALLKTGDGGASASAIVTDVGDLLGLADLATVNLETVIGSLPDAGAYPGKRWLLQSPPETLAALDRLGVHVASLANNHQRDWLDAGVQSTLDQLDAHGLPHVGAGLTAAQAEAPLRFDADGLQIGVIAFTSVNGDYVNDQYPTDGDIAPDEILAEDQFKWEFRSWGAPDLGVPVAGRRIGSAWLAVHDIEDDLSGDELAALWASAVAVYPELQDWVARRGHGGGSPWDDDSPGAIAALADTSDLTVVQLHMGYQFATAPGEAVISAARAAIDAGADLVVCHHPHVLQGLEWYNGKLIAYSLGNFLFDQDFLSTWHSSLLRTVWEQDRLVEARIIPLFLDRYRPVPVTDSLAADVARRLYEGSLLPAAAVRGEDLGVRPTLRDAPDAPGMRLDHGTVLLSANPPDPSSLTVEVVQGALTPLPRTALINRRLNKNPPAGLLAGRSLSGLGSFEDEDGDADRGDVSGWTWDNDDVLIDTRRPLSGLASLSLFRDVTSTEAVFARMIARIPLPAHRLYDANAVGLDGEATWSVRLLTERIGAESAAMVRADFYHFDDLDPTEDPESILLHSVELPFVAGKKQSEILLDMPLDAYREVDGLTPNAVLLYVVLEAPAAASTLLLVDEVEFIEWREAIAEPEGWAALDWLRGEGTVEVEMIGL